MQKKFLTNLALLLFLNLLIKPFWIFGIDRTVQNTLGAEAYGSYYVLLNFSFLFNILLDLGITNFNNRNIARHSQLFTKHFSGIIVMRLLLAGFYCIVSLAVGCITGYSFTNPALLIMLLFNQCLISFILYLRSNIAGLQLFRYDSIISVTDRFLMIIFCALLLWGNIGGIKFSIELYVILQTAAYILTALLAFIFLRMHAPVKKLSWNTAFYLTILKKSYPFALLILLMTFYNRIDSIMLERMLPDGALQAGIYAQAYRIFDAANMFAFLFAGLLLPMFARMLQQKEKIDELAGLSFSLLVIPAIALGIVCFFFRHELMVLMYHEHTEVSAPVFGLLMFGFTGMAVSYIFGTLLTANGNLSQLNIMAATAMIINIVLNLILIPQFKAKGAAISSVITQFFMAAVQYILCYRLFNLKAKSKSILRFLVFIAVSWPAVFYLSHSGFNWIASFVASGVLFLIMAIATRLFNLRGLKMILSERG